MTDATLAQANQFLTLIARSKSPHGSIQWLIENWGAVQELVGMDLTQATIKAALAHFNSYGQERVDPKFFYPEGYEPNLVGKQARILLGHFGWLDTSHVSEIAASWPEYEQADGLYVVPKPSSLAAHLGIEDHWNNFGLLTEQGPLAALAEQSGRKFKNYRQGKMGSEYYQLNETAKSALQALEADQPGDVLVFPAQTGRLYVGYSVRNSRIHIQHAENPSQWSLSAYVVGWMLYGNEHRLTAYKHLAIYAPGDEYNSGVDGEFGSALCFNFNGGSLEFDGRLFGSPDGRYGSASGFGRQ